MILEDKAQVLVNPAAWTFLGRVPSDTNGGIYGDFASEWDTTHVNKA